MHPRTFSLALLVAVALAAGCRQSDRMELAPVGATVNYNGKPLAHGSITFVPEHGRSATGKIEDGYIINMTTYVPGDGVPVGRHRVQIASFVREPQGMEIVPWVIPERYGNVETSGLTAEVVRKKQNDLAFELHD